MNKRKSRGEAPGNPDDLKKAAEDLFNRRPGARKLMAQCGGGMERQRAFLELDKRIDDLALALAEIHVACNKGPDKQVEGPFSARIAGTNSIVIAGNGEQDIDEEALVSLITDLLTGGGVSQREARAEEGMTQAVDALADCITSILKFKVSAKEAAEIVERIEGAQVKAVELLVPDLLSEMEKLFIVDVLQQRIRKNGFESADEESVERVWGVLCACQTLKLTVGAELAARIDGTVDGVPFAAFLIPVEVLFTNPSGEENGEWGSEQIIPRA